MALFHIFIDLGDLLLLALLLCQDGGIEILDLPYQVFLPMIYGILMPMSPQ